MDDWLMSPFPSANLELKFLPVTLKCLGIVSFQIFVGSD